MHVNEKMKICKNEDPANEQESDLREHICFPSYLGFLLCPT